MVTVTERAKEELKTLLSDSVDDPGMGFRLVLRATGQFGLVPDVEKEGDHVVEYEGAKVLLIDEETSGLLVNAAVDCRHTPQGAQLVISRRA